MGLELLAPAKNADQGILAFRCGADAVYMGGPRFGARQGATCGIEDFERLASEARLWDGKVYATLNTILFDGELEEARAQAWRLADAGVDAFIVQDMAYLEMDLPSVPLHASTQAACDGPGKVAFLASVGFRRAILARELSLAEIRAIHDATAIELEAFVFGALCVGESGRCALSQALGGRSGNRGACAQPCRAPWSLLDASGRVLLRDQPLLSIRDLDLSDHLEALAEAGITSFKIEGRLKDADYVKNVVTHFRLRLDALLEPRPEWARASLGRVEPGFRPDPAKTFQRGHTSYRLEGLRHPLASPPGHLGEPIGTVRSVKGDRVTMKEVLDLHPGDGVAFLDAEGRMAGSPVNAAEESTVVLQDPSRVRPGLRLHRNLDHAWLKALRAARTRRRIPVRARLDFPEGAIRLEFEDETGLKGGAERPGDFAPAKDPEGGRRQIKEALERLGDTPFTLESLDLAEGRFVPVSLLNALRREAAERLEQERRAPRPRAPLPPVEAPPAPLPERELDFAWNVSNRLARAFYERHGARILESAAELQKDLRGRVLMTCRHCLKYELGWCPTHPHPGPPVRLPIPPEPLFLTNGPTRLRCRFDCARCRMLLVLE